MLVAFLVFMALPGARAQTDDSAGTDQATVEAGTDSGAADSGTAADQPAAADAANTAAEPAAPTGVQAAPPTPPAPGTMKLSTDRYVYRLSDAVAFTISLDSAGANLSGNLVMKIYSPASGQSAAAYTGEPIDERTIASNQEVSGSEKIGYTADLKDLKITGTGGYPVAVSFVQDGKEVLSGRGWLAVVEPTDRAPLDVALLWSVASPPERNPAGEFENLDLAGRCQVPPTDAAAAGDPASAGNLLQYAALQQKFPSVRNNYAIEPALLDQLSSMAGGFTLRQGGQTQDYPPDSPDARAASGCLESLRQLAAGNAAGDAYSEMIAAPYAYTNLPLLARNGWDDGFSQYRIGDDIITKVLQLKEVPHGSYAPALNVTTDSLRYVAVTGGEYVVLSGSSRPNVAGRPGTEGAISYRLRDVGGERVTAFFADEDASIGLMGADADPNAFFAALANAYAASAQLDIAAAPVPVSSLTTAQRDKVYETIAAEPWLTTVTMSQAKETYRPQTMPSTLLEYVDPVSGYVEQTYFQKLDSVHKEYEAYRAGVDSAEPELDVASRKLFTAESAYLTGANVAPEQANRGMAYLDDIAGFLQGELRGLSISVSTPLFQGSGDGEATVEVTNGNLYPFNADIAIEGGADFPDGPRQHVQIQPGTTELKLPYRSQGWTGLKVSIQSAGEVIAGDSATIHPVTGRVWAVIGIGLAALMGGMLYVTLVVRRR